MSTQNTYYNSSIHQLERFANQLERDFNEKVKILSNQDMLTKIGSLVSAFQTHTRLFYSELKNPIPNFTTANNQLNQMTSTLMQLSTEILLKRNEPTKPQQQVFFQPVIAPPPPNTNASNKRTKIGEAPPEPHIIIQTTEPQQSPVPFTKNSYVPSSMYQANNNSQSLPILTTQQVVPQSQVRKPLALTHLSDKIIEGHKNRLENLYLLLSSNPIGFYNHLTKMVQDIEAIDKRDFIPDRNYTQNIGKGFSHLCRYRNIFAWDHNIYYTKNGFFTNYSPIKSCRVDSPYDNYKYLAGEGPKINTLPYFFDMVRQEKATIVTLVMAKEKDSNTGTMVEKCLEYWNPNYGPMNLPDGWTVVYKNQNTIHSSSSDPHNIIKREFTASKPGEQDQILTQYHLENWVDQGSATIKSLLKLVDLLDPDVLPGPIVVHCSAGIGRTGTFITIHDLIYFIKTKLAQSHDRKTTLETLEINIVEHIISLRMQRMAMVQTLDQFFTIIRTLIDYYSDEKNKKLLTY